MKSESNIRTIRVMLHPNNKQKTKLFEFAGAARYTYNWALNFVEEYYVKNNKLIGEYELRKEFTKHKQLTENAWLYSISGEVTKQAVKDLYKAYKQYLDDIANKSKTDSK